jgi:hypothetical protein
MGRLDAADKMAAAKKIAVEADKKTYGPAGKPPEPPRNPGMDKSMAKRTDPDQMGSGTSMKGRLYNQDEYDYGMKKGGSVSSASKRADGCAVRGKTKA